VSPDIGGTLILREDNVIIGVRGDSGEAERLFGREAERHSAMIPNTIERSDAGFSVLPESVRLRQLKPVRSAKPSESHPPQTHQTVHPPTPTETVAWAP
jgi:hypothetical protein